MMIPTIFTALEAAEKPVVRVFHKTEKVKTLAIGFRKGMTLKEHLTPVPAKLVVLKGVVTYIEGESERTLKQFEDHDIPVNVIHAVNAEEESLILVIQDAKEEAKKRLRLWEQ